MDNELKPKRERTTAAVKEKVIKMLDYAEAWDCLPPHYTEEVMELLKVRGLFIDIKELALADKVRKVREKVQFNFDIALAIYTVACKYHPNLQQLGGSAD
ncbi:hypothetical protein [uncultured Microscilla sp.]|uniref:hypothetical protein n=1 Tax=uncultured Microscilla sp. TaxID=432653 RepID=UPI00261821C8|nr:hypothetical protein [uncultured Microscilla sp.]